MASLPLPLALPLYYLCELSEEPGLLGVLDAPVWLLLEWGLPTGLTHVLLLLLPALPYTSVRVVRTSPNRSRPRSSAPPSRTRARCSTSRRPLGQGGLREPARVFGRFFRRLGEARPWWRESVLRVEGPPGTEVVCS